MSLVQSKTLGAAVRCVLAGLLAAVGPTLGRLATTVEPRDFLSRIDHASGPVADTLGLSVFSSTIENVIGQIGSILHLSTFFSRLEISLGQIAEKFDVSWSVSRSFWPWVLPLLCSLGVVLCNIGMWGLYLSGMGALTSLQATVINSGSNIACSGLLGWLFLGEHVNARWLAGIGLICLGIVLILAGSTSDNTKDKED